MTGHTDDGGPLCIIDDLQAALEEVASPNNAYGEPANSAVQVWTPALGKELPVWQDWPSAEDRRSVANRIFPARHPDHGLGYFEFPAPPQEHWVCCFGAAGWEEMRTCLLSAAADLGGCYGASYPLRVALQLRGSSGPDAWTGVMRFGWDAVNVKPLHPHFQAMIKFAYETLMKWHLTVLNGQMVALDKWTSEALALQIRRPDAIWGEIEHFRARLKLQQQTELAEREKRDSLRIEKEVFTVDEDHARLLAEENFEYIRHWAERCIDEQRGKAMPGPEARDWLIRWVHEGVDWRLFPFKEIIYSSVRMEVADKFAVEVMATCAKELWKDYAVGEQVEVLAARDLDGLALSEFYAWIRFNPEDNQWCGLLASRTRGRIMLEAFDDLAVQAAMDYPDNEAVHMALRDERVGLLEAVDDAVAAERRDQLGTPEPEIEFE